MRKWVYVVKKGGRREIIWDNREENGERNYLSNVWCDILNLKLLENRYRSSKWKVILLLEDMWILYSLCDHRWEQTIVWMIWPYGTSLPPWFNVLQLWERNPTRSPLQLPDSLTHSPTVWIRSSVPPSFLWISWGSWRSTREDATIISKNHI